LLLAQPEVPPVEAEASASPGRQRSLIGRLVQLHIGLALYGVAIAFRVRSNLGLDPWGAFHQGISQVTGLSFGTATIVVGAAILLTWIPFRLKPGIGTISNILVIGLVADGVLALLPEIHWPPLRYALMVAGTLLTGASGAVYMAAGLGTGPRDGLMVGIVRYTRWPIRRVRGGIELTVLASGWLLGGTIGIGTVIHALLIGPCLDYSVRVTAALGFGDGAR
jgi:uncharacterized membrane protein YczE